MQIDPGPCISYHNMSPCTAILIKCQTRAGYSASSQQEGCGSNLGDWPAILSEGNSNLGGSA